MLSCVLLARAAKQSSSETIERLKASLKNEGGLSLLPREFRRQFLARDFVDGKASIDKSMLCTDSHGMGITYRLERRSKNIGWDEICEDFPYYILHVLERNGTDAEGSSLAKWLNSGENMEKFLCVIEASNLRGSLSFGQLGFFFKEFPKFADQFKRLVASSPVNGRGSFLGNDIAPFALDLPTDVELLPHLAAFCFLDPDNYRLEDHHRSGSLRSADESSREFVPDVSKLRDVWHDKRHKNEIVAAAGVLLLADPHLPPLEAQEIYKRLIDLYCNDYSYWLVPSVLECITQKIASGDTSSLDFADKLMKRSREDMPARSAAERVISNWREITREPVHVTMSRGIWQE